MRSVNKVILMGNLAADPEMRSTTTGKTVTNFPLATNSEWYDDNGEKQKAADFHRVVTWQGLAEACGKTLTKGSAVYVEGRIRNRSFEDKNGDKRYVTEVTADRVNFIQIKRTTEGEEVGLEDTETTEDEATKPKGRKKKEAVAA